MNKLKISKDLGSLKCDFLPRSRKIETFAGGDFYDLKLKHPWYPKFGSLGKLRVKVLDKISVDGLKEDDIAMLTKKAFDTIKVELENDPKKAAFRATEKWKKILA